MKKVVIAPQGFKESRTGMEIARAMEAGVKRVWPQAQTVLVPVADGGDGTLQSLVDVSGGRVETAVVTDPLGRRIEAQWGALGDGVTAVIEMARSSGLALLARDERDPLGASTRGVGELFRAALDAGHKKFIVGIGGSATNDAGAGMAQALGARFLDRDGNDLPPGGRALARLDRIDLSGFDARIADAEVVVACDVNNPLCGDTGASAIFGPQKGATPDMVRELDAALARFAEIVKRDVGKDVSQRPGAGAAGGLGAGLMAFMDAELRLGADIVLDAVKLEKKLEGADLVIVGEGQFDKSTVFDKSPVGVAKRAAKLGVPVIGIAGSLGEGFEKLHDMGIAAVFSLVSGPMSLQDAMDDTDRLVTRATEEACRAIALGMARNA
jgi:glycerate kinase